MGKKSKGESRKDLGGLLSSMQGGGKPARGFPSGGDTTGSDTTGSDTAGSDTAGSDTAGSDTAGSDTAGGEESRSGEEKPAAEVSGEESLEGSRQDPPEAEKASGEDVPGDDPGGRATRHPGPEEEKEELFYDEGTYRRKGGERQARLTTYVDESTKKGVSVMASLNGQSVSQFLADLLEEHELRYEQVVEKL